MMHKIVKKTIAMIFARGGSKGVPGKNIRPLAGKPLIAYSIEMAQAIKQVDEIIVSTDDEKIAETARQWDAQVPFMRPPELARDDSPEWLAWRHALAWVRARDGELPRVMLSLPTTSPLRTKEDVEKCLELFDRGGADGVVCVRPAERNPYFNMVTLSSEGIARRVIMPEGKPVTRRQDAPEVFDMTTVAYAISPEFVFRANGLFEGKVKAVVIPTEHTIDIDTELDFEMAEFLMSKRLSRGSVAGMC